METTNIVDFTRRDGMTDALTELLRKGAQDLIATAVESELTGIWRNLQICALRQAMQQSCAMGIILNVPFRRALAL